MDKKLFLSIITVNFNNSNGLKKTIESVMSQSSNDYEHIIIDGGSNDDSVEVIQNALQDSNYSKQLSYWHSKKDKGIYDGMNKGIEKANGEFCLFLNSGDFLADNDVIQRFSKMNFSTNEIVYTDALFFDSKKEWRVSYPSKITLDFFYQTKSLSHQNMLFPSSFIKNNHYDLKWKIGADVALYFKAFVNNNFQFKYIKDVISKFEAEEGLSSNTSWQKRHEERLEQIREYLPDYVIDILERLDTYENKYHGILRKMKNMLGLYSRIRH